MRRLALALLLLLAPALAWAQTNNEEGICRPSSPLFDPNVFNCENFQDYPTGPVTGDLPAHYKQGVWGLFSGDSSIVNAVGPQGNLQHMWEAHYNPTVQGGGQGGTAALQTTLLQQRSDLYVRWYAKFVDFRFSVISTKHFEFVSSQPAGSTNVHLWSNHSDGSPGSLPLNTSDPVFQNQNAHYQPFEFRQNLNNPKVFEGPSVAGFANNIWYCLEAHVVYRVGTNSSYEGWIQRVGIDPAPVQKLGLNGIGIANIQLVAEQLLIATYWNCYGTGTDPTCIPNSQPADVHGHMWRYTTNIAVSSQRIGCLGSQVPPTPNPPTNFRFTLLTLGLAGVGMLALRRS